MTHAGDAHEVVANSGPTAPRVPVPPTTPPSPPSSPSTPPPLPPLVPPPAPPPPSAGSRITVDLPPAPTPARSVLAPWNGDGEVERSNDRLIRIAIDIGVVAFCMLFVFLQLGPSNILKDTTPAGGDMGAHVWGPAYLRDHLLPNFQLTGWTPDWYAGFPAYQFYMVVPPLAIVLLDLGVSFQWAGLPILAALAAVVAAVRFRSRPGYRAVCLGLAVVALLCISLPYSIAFKLVSVTGPICLPLAAYTFGRLANLRFPTPTLLAVATLPFLFYRRYTIWGGNLSSMLAGEFAFSISLCIALIYLGVVLRGIENGKHRGLAAGLLALCALCHLIPFFWVAGATLVIVAVRPRRSTAPVAPCLAVGIAGALLAASGVLVLRGDLPGLIGLALLVTGIALLWVAGWLASQTVRWLTPTLVVAGMLGSFWLVPAVARRPFMNDFGWQKVPYFDQDESWGDYLLPQDGAENDLRWAFVLALIAFGLSMALRLRAGIFLGVVAIVNALVVWAIPEGQLWNARLLPFYYLAVILLAGLAVGEVMRLVVALVNPGRPVRAPVGAATSLVGLLVVLVMVGVPLGALPWDKEIEDTNGNVLGHEWPSWSPWQLEARPNSYVNSWANWNYSGYEGKENYPEYRDIVQTMKGLGEDEDYGCGRAYWEYDQSLDRYGTPMAMMLLPYWTDGCIGSMEGLYFESSMTTPFHFMMSSELSTAPSNPQRDLPYGTIDADFNKGVQQLQLMGVRYYMAFSDKALAQARAHPDLTEIAESAPWSVFEVANSELVVGLPNEPAVLDDIGNGIDEWLHHPRNASDQFSAPPVAWFNDPSLWEVMITADGPDDWQRVEVADEPPATPADSYATPEVREVTPAQVSNIDASDEDSISFDVDRVGSPVLVKVSYFPNWSVSGAEGPYRVAPNLMVVVPTEHHVELQYGRTKVEWFAYGLSFLGIALLVVLVRRGTYRFRDPQPSNGAMDGGTGGVAA